MCSENFLQLTYSIVFTSFFEVAFTLVASTKRTHFRLLAR